MEPLSTLPKGQDLTKQERAEKKAEAPKQDRAKLITEMLEYFGTKANETMVSIYIGGLASLTDDNFARTIGRAIVQLKERPMIVDLAAIADKFVKVDIEAKDAQGPTYAVMMTTYGAYCGNPFSIGQVLRTKNPDVAQALERMNAEALDRHKIEEDGDWKGADKMKIDPYYAGQVTEAGVVPPV